jgi:amidase
MSDGDPLHYRSLAETAADIKTGALSSEQVTRHIVDRIAALEPTLHAFTEVRTVAALEEARKADQRQASGGALGSLHGVPVAVKDLCSMAGTATGAGGLFRTRFAPADTATIVRRLQEAGAIIVGKLVLTEGAWGTHHPTTAQPVNPWTPNRWPGVSSSGSGVSVAAGMAYGAIGSDTAGSIRFPSAANHLVGLKPTWGRVSRRGVFPLSDTFDHVGPMARSVVDVALMFGAIAGVDPEDPTTLDAPLDDYAAAARPRGLNGVRIGLDADYALTGLDAVTEVAMRAAIATLQAAGATIVEVSVGDVRSILEKAIEAAFVEAAVSHAPTYPSEKSTYTESYARLLDIGYGASALDYAAVSIWRREFHGRLRRIFHQADMLVVPVMPIESPTVVAWAEMLKAPLLSAAPLLAYTLPYNLAGVPSLTLPMGSEPSNGPLGFQLIGPDLSEAQLLSVGAAYEQAAGTAAQHPGL